MGNLPIGQGQLVTPLQMATAYAAIANGGILRPPHIIAKVGSEAQGEPAGRRVISPATAASLRQMLEGVLAPGGTASEVSIPGYQLAGKTGTASKVDQATGEYSKSLAPEAAVRGDRRRTAERLDLRRHGGRAGVRPDHELRAALPAHPARIASAR
jgi:cell division protein FtsI/penicillin-binding protein 2